MAEKGAVTKTGEPGGKIYFQLKEHHHAHELECLACHKHIMIDECPVESFSRTLNKETGFVVTEHHLQLKGLCASVQAIPIKVSKLISLGTFIILFLHKTS